MDKGEVTAMTLLDLSAAFDTIDNATFADELSDWSEISGQAQIWFSFYLQNRHQSVKNKYTLSDQVTLLYGVPQGSVLGPVFLSVVSNAKESLEKLQYLLMGVGRPG